MGIHLSCGYDEERMVRFSRELSRLGNLVVTPEIEDLKNYEITTCAVNDIRDAAVWLLDSSSLVKPNRKISTLGFSFAGGLSVHVAAAPELRDRIGVVGHRGINAFHLLF